MIKIILFSLINIVYIFVFLIIFYSVFELPLKKIFKYFIKGNEIIDEEDENEEIDMEEKDEDSNFLMKNKKYLSFNNINLRIKINFFFRKKSHFVKISFNFIFVFNR